jgi:NAD(P)-dependent dehydrogenase (short-subunit alcohol dehydrogenase family)
MTTSNPFSLTDKVALITGGGRGIGAGIARAFVEAGARVALVSRTKEQVEGTAAELNEGGEGRALPLPADVTDLDTLPGLVERVVGEFGGLDVVVNCAGGGDMWRAFLDNTVEEVESAFHFNVTVPFALVQAATPQLLERPGSSVINIISGAIANPTRGHLSYDASKGALLYATRSMAAALGPRVRVNGIHPGIIETEAMKAVVAGREGILEQLTGRVRMRRLGTPNDIGLAAVYLASPAASYLTGVMLDVDGGPVGEMQPMFPDL